MTTDSKLVLKLIKAENREDELKLLNNDDKNSLLMHLLNLRNKCLAEKRRYYAKKKHAGCEDQESSHGEGPGTDRE
jgi:hypothetical protein